MVGGVHGRGVCMAGVVHGREACVAGGMHGRGVCGRGGHVWQSGAWVADGHVWGTCVAGGHVWQGGHAWQEACMTCTPSPPTLRVMVGQCVGGTHPTGMHSYFLNLFYYYYSKATIFILEL